MITPESFNAALVKVFGAPEVRAKLDQLDRQFDESLRRCGVTRKALEDELVRRQLAAFVAGEEL